MRTVNNPLPLIAAALPLITFLALADNAAALDTSSQTKGETPACHATGQPGAGAGAEPSRKTAAPDQNRVEKGDLVRVNYTITLEDGSLVTTTLPALAGDQGAVHSAVFELPKVLEPVEVLAGEKGSMPGVGEGVLGMAAGEKKRLELQSEQAFGARDERKQIRQPRENQVPRSVKVPAKDFVARFDSFPVVGKEVPLAPHIVTRVGEVTDKEVRLDLSAQDGTSYQEAFGSIGIKVSAERITLRLTPRIGAVMPSRDGQGRVVAMDDDSFTLDYNHPLAGKKIKVDLQLVSLVKGDRLPTAKVDWLEGHEAGLAAAQKAGKPAVLVLYAEWCQWCKKLFAESVQDPRVKELKDSFVWVKVNSNQQTQYKERYGQSGFPMIVLLRPDGTVAAKNEGFLDGAALAGELRSFLAAKAK